jgi:hypothetical protein
MRNCVTEPPLNFNRRRDIPSDLVEAAKKLAVLQPTRTSA